MSASAPSTHLGRPWSRIGPCLFVLACVPIGMLIFATSMYLVGKHSEDRRSMLKNYRAPNHFEIQSFFLMDYVLNSSEMNDVLFIGDSTVLEGLLPRQFEKETGLKAYCFNIGSYALVLTRYLEHHPRPRLVVFCFWPRYLELDTSSYDAVRRQFYWCYGPGTEDTRPPHHQPVRDYVQMGCRVTLGYLSGGFERYATEPVIDRAGANYNDIVAMMTEERGHWERPAAPPPRPESATRFLENPNQLYQPTLNAINDLARVAQENGIPLLVRFPPLVSGSGPQDMTVINDWTRGMEAIYPRLTVSRPQIMHYDSDYFSDVVHPNRKGAEKFTSFTASEVKKVLVRQTGS